MKAERKQIVKRICVSFMLIIVLVVAWVFGGGYSAPTAYAETNSDLAFDDTYVMDDLSSSTVNGVSFDFSGYVFDSSKNIQVISVVEYCYTESSYAMGNYGLYVYLYNPSQADILTDSKQNRIQLSTAYDDEGIPVDYDKFALEFCSMSTDSGYYGMFYKFRVVDREIDGKYYSAIIRDYVSEFGCRRYDISGIELLESGQTVAQEYEVALTYKFTGYAEGCGTGAETESTLSCVATDLLTVSLEVKSTYYRDIQGTGNNLNTVYFGIDDDILEEYGRLQKIKAEWYEYKTQPVLIVNDESVAAALLPYMGVSVFPSGYEVPVYEGVTNAPLTRDVVPAARSDVPYGVWQLDSWYTTSSVGSTIQYTGVNWAWNANYESGFPSEITFVNASGLQDKLYYVFYTDEDDTSDFFVSSDDFQSYVESYSNSYDNGMLEIKDGVKISADLFSDSVDEGRVRGYNVCEFDADDDTFNLITYDVAEGFWEKFLELFNVKQYSEKNISPIYAVTDSDLSLSDSELAAKLLIDETDITEFRLYCAQQKSLDKTVYLFRFAVTEYNAFEVYVEGSTQNYLSTGVIAEQTVFLDFDILTLTLNKDGVYTVIPAVSSPIDIYNDFTGVVDDGFDWDTLLGLILGVLGLIVLVVLIVVLWPLIVLLLKAVIWIISLPFKAISAIYKSVKKRRQKKKDKSADNSKKANSTAEKPKNKSK